MSSLYYVHYSHCNDAGSVPTLVTDELQIERNASGHWQWSIWQAFRYILYIIILYIIYYFSPISKYRINNKHLNIFDQSYVRRLFIYIQYSYNKNDKFVGLKEWNERTTTVLPLLRPVKMSDEC